MGYTKNHFIKRIKSQKIFRRTALSWPIDTVVMVSLQYQRTTDYQALHYCKLSLHLHIPRLSYPIH